MRGQRDAELTQWQTYCRAQAQEQTGQTETRERPATGCPPGFVERSIFNEQTGEPEVICERAAVAVPTPPTAPTPTEPVAPTAPTPPPPARPDDTTQVTQGSFRVSGTTFTGRATQFAQSAITPAVAPTAAVSLAGAVSGPTTAGWTFTLPSWAAGETATRNSRIQPPADAANGAYTITLTASGGNYAGQTITITITLETPAAPVEPPPETAIVPCAEGQERVTQGGPCVDECGENERRNAFGDCEAIPVADPTCGTDTATSSVPDDVDLPSDSASTGYSVSVDNANRRFTETLQQVRNADGVCESDWPPPPSFEGFTSARDPVSGVVTYTEIVEVEEQDCPDPGTCGDGQVWSASLCQCVASTTAAPTAVARPTTLGANAGWLTFLANGGERVFTFGTPIWMGEDTPLAERYEGVDAEAALDSFRVWTGSEGNFSLSTVSAATALGGYDVSTVAQEEEWKSPFFWSGIRLAHGTVTIDDKTGEPTNYNEGFDARLYFLDTLQVQPINPAYNMALNIVVTPVLDPTNSWMIGLKFKRIDKQDLEGWGIAINVSAVSVYLRYGRFGQDINFVFARTAEAVPPPEVAADPARAAAWQGYRPLYRVYGKNEVALPEFTWTETEGFAQAARLLRTHDGEAVHPYRRVRLGYSSTNEPEAELIEHGEWVRTDNEVHGQRYRFEANVRRKRIRWTASAAADIEAEAVISPVSSEFAEPFTLDDSRVDGRDVVG